MELTQIWSEKSRFGDISTRRINFLLLFCWKAIFRQLLIPISWHDDNHSGRTVYMTFWVVSLRLNGTGFKTIWSHMTNDQSDKVFLYRCQMALSQLTNQSSEIISWCQSVSTSIAQPALGRLFIAWEKRTFVVWKWTVQVGRTFVGLNFYAIANFLLYFM